LKIVVDSNIVFSALLSSNSKLRKILLEGEFEFYAPKDLLLEILSHRDKIIRHSKNSIEILNVVMFELFSRILFVEDNFITDESYAKAYNLCKNYDPTDTPFVALTIQLGAKFWTGDKIKEHLIALGFNDIFEY
jgi:predicted nucleic acid-binding protein